MPRLTRAAETPFLDMTDMTEAEIEAAIAPDQSPRRATAARAAEIACLGLAVTFAAAVSVLVFTAPEALLSAINGVLKG